jgi:hypothetical protein
VVTTVLFLFIGFIFYFLRLFAIQGGFLFGACYFSYLGWAFLKFSFDYVNHIHVYRKYRWVENYDNCHVSGTVDEYLANEATPQWLYFWVEDCEQMGGNIGETFSIEDDYEEEEDADEEGEDILNFKDEIRDLKLWHEDPYTNYFLWGKGLRRGRKGKFFKEKNPRPARKYRYSYVRGYGPPTYYPRWAPISVERRGSTRSKVGVRRKK